MKSEFRLSYKTSRTSVYSPHSQGHRLHGASQDLQPPVPRLATGAEKAHRAHLRQQASSGIQGTTAHYSLLTSHCSLLAAHCSLLTAHCLLLTAAHCLLLTAHCSLRTAYCSLRTTRCGLRTAHSTLPLLTVHCAQHWLVVRAKWYCLKQVSQRGYV